jgi:hypothetical protein
MLTLSGSLVAKQKPPRRSAAVEEREWSDGLLWVWLSSTTVFAVC